MVLGSFGIHARVEAVAAHGHEAIGIGQIGELVLGRAAEAVVVLRAAVDVVEGRVLADGDVVHLGGGQVLLEVPGGGAVEGFVEAAVAAHQVMVVVLRVDPDIVIVHVLVAGAERGDGAAAIVAHHDVHVHDVDAVGVGRVHLHLGVILALLVEGAALFPGDAVVGGAVGAAAAFGAFHLRVDDAGIGGRLVEADAAEFAGGEAAAHRGPGLAGVDGAVERAFRAAVNHAEVAALALVGGRQQDIGIARVHDDVAASGVVADFDEAGRPGLAAVGGLVQAALAAALPEGAGGGHVHHVGIARVHHDAGDVLGELEAHVAEGAPAVFALIDAVAVGDAALVVVLARAHPDDGGILGIDGDPADGVGAVVVEDRGPGGAVVGGGEDVAGGHGNQVVVGIVREHGDLGDASGDEGRADLARPEGGEGVFVDGLVGAGAATAAAAAAAGGRWFILREGGQGKTQKERK